MIPVASALRQGVIANRFVATYHYNFRCEMCGVWQKKNVNELTPMKREHKLAARNRRLFDCGTTNWKAYASSCWT